MLVQWGPEHEPVVEAGTERRCCLCVCVLGDVDGEKKKDDEMISSAPDKIKNNKQKSHLSLICPAENVDSKLA